MDITTDLYNALPWEATEQASSQIAQLCYVDSTDVADFPDELAQRIGRGFMFVQFQNRSRGTEARHGGQLPGAQGELSIYVYFDVPREAYAAVQQADESPGRALNFAIKGHFEYERLHPHNG